MHDRDRLSNAEKAVQRKVRDGKRLNSDDRSLIQTRLRAMQKRGELDGQTVGIPSGALNIVPMPNIQPAIAAMNATARTMQRGGIPDFGSNGSQLETAIRQINGGHTTAYFNLSTNTTYRGIPVLWTANGSFGLGPLHWVREGTGSMSGTQNTGGGNASGNTASSGGSANASGSGTVSGANVSGGGSISGGGSNSAGQSGGANASQGGAASSVTDTYTAEITMSCTLRAQPELTFNPLSWGASLAEAFMDPTTATSTASGCGRIQFTIQG